MMAGLDYGSAFKSVTRADECRDARGRVNRHGNHSLSQSLYRPAHKIHEVTPGQKSLDRRASRIKIERRAIHHAIDILSHAAKQMLIS